eukprot:363049-Chlamydomonas_euryale.AAC.14
MLPQCQQMELRNILKGAACPKPRPKRACTLMRLRRRAACAPCAVAQMEAEEELLTTTLEKRLAQASREQEVVVGRLQKQGGVGEGMSTTAKKEGNGDF